MSIMHIEPLTARYLTQFCMYMRPEDMAECLAGSDSVQFLDTPVQDLAEIGTCALMYGNEVLGIGGVHKGCIWMLCTTLVEKHRIAFLRYMKALIPEIRKHTKVPLYNHAWKMNKLHIDWLKWLDAKFYKEDEYGFLYFYWEPLKDGD